MIQSKLNLDIPTRYLHKMYYININKLHFNIINRPLNLAHTSSSWF